MSRRAELLLVVLHVGVASAFNVALAPRHAGRDVGRRSEHSSSMGVTSEEMGIPCVDECALPRFPNLPPSVHPGVVTGQAMIDLLEHAKANKYAIPAVNCVTSSSVNACLEAARKADAPIIIQFSSGGSQFYAGKGLDNTDFKAAIAGAVSGAYHVRAMAEQYGVPVILHTDHCAKKLLPWVDGMLEASERYYKAHGEPLFSSHMIDLSEEPLEENLEICVDYLKRMTKLDMLLEMELGVTGGEEDGVNNEDVDPEDLYSKPEEIWEVHQTLSKVPDAQFTVAAAFGNVHGVYAPGNVKLTPDILTRGQKYVSSQLGLPAGSKPLSFVFHGGSGSDLSDIRQSIDYGVIKMNIDTDTQWAYWAGVKDFEAKYRPYLQTQIGNPEGPTKPNKKHVGAGTCYRALAHLGILLLVRTYLGRGERAPCTPHRTALGRLSTPLSTPRYYDPREMMRAAETSTAARLAQCFDDLRCVNVLGLGEATPPTNVAGPRRGSLPV